MYAYVCLSPAIRSAQTDRNVPVMVEPRENTHSTIFPNQTPLATPASARAQLLQVDVCVFHLVNKNITELERPVVIVLKDCNMCFRL